MKLLVKIVDFLVRLKDKVKIINVIKKNVNVHSCIEL